MDSNYNKYDNNNNINKGFPRSDFEKKIKKIWGGDRWKKKKKRKYINTYEVRALFCFPSPELKKHYEIEVDKEPMSQTNYRSACVLIGFL